MLRNLDKGGGDGSWNVFTSVKDFLDTGFFEGVRVKYLLKRQNIELDGIIEGNRYRCGCASCDFRVEPISANKFEFHSGGISSYANNNIHLPNGWSLIEVVKYLNDVPLASLHKEMEVVSGCKINLELYEAWRNRLPTASSGRISTALCGGVRRKFEKKQVGVEVPSEIVRTKHKVKQMGVKVTTIKEAGLFPFNNRLPLDLSFPQQTTFLALTWNGQDHEVTSHKKKLRSGSYSFLPPEVSEVNILKGDALKTQENFMPKTPPTPQRKQVKDILHIDHLNVRNILATGLLEGLPVKYKKDKVELDGIIKDQQYQCGCKLCNNNEVICALDFERHAGSNSKNQNNHIFLESGISLYKLVKELKELGNVSHDSFCHAIKEKIHTCLSTKQDVWKGSLKTTSSSLQSSNVNVKNNQPAELSERLELHTVPVYASQILCSQSDGRSYVPVKGHPNTPPCINVTSPRLALEGCVTSTSSIDSSMTIPGSATEGSGKAGLDTFRHSSPIKEKALIESKSERMRRLPDSSVLSESAIIPVLARVAAKADRRKRSGDLHKTVFDGIQDGTELFYCSSGQIVLEGYKLKNGIFCKHCQTVVSPSMFESHAGFAPRRQPYRNIYTSEDISIHDLGLSSTNDKKLPSVCTICRSDRELVSCGQCQKAIHRVCLCSPSNPDDNGEWYCSSCKDNLGSGIASKVMPPRAAGQDNLPLRREIKLPTDSCCALCTDTDIDASETIGPKTALFCGQCEKEYHVGCLEDNEICSIKERPFPWFSWLCSSVCSKIHDNLLYLAQTGPQSLPGRLLSMLERKTAEKGKNCEDGIVVQWQLLSGKHRSHENESLFLRATAIFQDAFDTIVKKKHDEQKLEILPAMPAMVNGEEVAGLAFGGMYCAAITIKSEIVSAGLLRVFGRDVAELPLVATTKESRGKGYFQTLLATIEQLLIELQVKYLIVSVDKDSQPIWINKFHFVKMAEKRVRNYALKHWILMFKGTVMLEKALYRSQC